MTSRILVLHDTPDELTELLRQRCGDAAIRYATKPTEVLPALHEFSPTAVLSIKHSSFPGAAHRPAAHHPSVRWLHVGGSGYEHLRRWDPARLTVTHSAGVLAPFLAETTLAAMLSLAVELPRFADQQRQRLWTPRRFKALSGRTLLVIGVGRVGGEVATRAKALGMNIIGIRSSSARHPAVQQMHGPDDLSVLLPRADVVSVHARLDASTRGMLGAEQFAQMKPGALLLNSSRGAVLHEGALIEALTSGQVGGAWLDVFAVEPLPRTSPLWSMANVLITPHCADQVVDFPRRFAERFCDLRDASLAGERLPALSPPPEDHHALQ